MIKRITIPTLISLLTLAACGSGEFTISSSQGTSGLTATGKTDAVRACEIERALAIVNDPATTEDDLKSIGFYSRARRNVLEHRAGADGVFGTADDDLFDSLEELDSVRYVGVKTIAKLLAFDSAACILSGAGSVEVVFSPNTDWTKTHLARVTQWIDATTETIDLAMYSMSDSRVLDALEDAAARGVSIRLLFESASKDRSSPSGTRSARLEDAGIDVRYINKIMHHKFAIFDGPRRDLAAAMGARLASGSANWSSSAGSRYDENTLFIDGNVELTLRMQKEFDHLWNNSRDFVWNTSIVPEFGSVVTDEDIAAADTDAVDAACTSENFRTYVSSRYGNTFSVVRGLSTVSDRLVDLIWSADRSIILASGHLRSRPVAEALIAKHQADPSVDIRVLLDGQEYLSSSTNTRQLNELAECLDAATTTIQEARCIDSGFLFSYEVHTAGIPLRYKYYSYRWHYSYAKQMHHKFFVVDGRTLVTGSYNLSDNAEHNTMENVMFFDGAIYPDLVAAYVLNFEKLWNLSRAEDLYGARLDDVQNGTSGSIPIVFDSMTLSWNEVRALKSAISANCSDVNTYAFRTNPQAHWYCTRG